jgi:hypothetical protein
MQGNMGNMSNWQGDGQILQSGGVVCQLLLYAQLVSKSLSYTPMYCGLRAVQGIAGSMGMGTGINTNTNFQQQDASGSIYMPPLTSNPNANASNANGNSTNSTGHVVHPWCSAVGSLLLPLPLSPARCPRCLQATFRAWTLSSALALASLTAP